MRTLVVLRHAKTEPYADTDHARELITRGHQQSRVVGAQLTEYVPGSVVALVSTARRAQQTWDDVATSLDVTIDRVDSDALYSADEDQLLQAIHDVCDSEESVIVVGHNPTVSGLCALLSGGPLRAGADVVKWGQLRTACGVVLEYDGSWADLGSGDCTITAYVGPDLAG